MAKQWTKRTDKEKIALMKKVDALTAKGYSKVDAAEEVGISPGMIHRWKTLFNGTSFDKQKRYDNVPTTKKRAYKRRATQPTFMEIPLEDTSSAVVEEIIVFRGKFTQENINQILGR